MGEAQVSTAEEGRALFPRVRLWIPGIGVDSAEGVDCVLGLECELEGVGTVEFCVEGVDYVLDLELLECELGCVKFGFSLM